MTRVPPAAGDPLLQAVPADAVPAARSPCRGICRLDDADLCLGCRRTSAEIVAWGGMTDRQRQVVLDRLARSGTR